MSAGILPNTLLTAKGRYSGPPANPCGDGDTVAEGAVPIIGG